MTDPRGMHRAWLGPSLSVKIQEWLQEDCPSVDWAGYLVGNQQTNARIYAKSPGVIAGGPVVTEIFLLLGCQIQWNIEEGSKLTLGSTVAEIKGPAANLLLGERLALNILSRLSGIATLTRSIRSIMDDHGFARVKLTDTRKTTPGNL